MQADRRWNVMLTACWLIWKARCAGAFQGKPPKPDRLVAAVWKAVSVTSASNSAKLKQLRTATMQARPSGTPAAQVRYWIPPEEGSIKINCDGAWSSSSGHDGVGVVARNHAGAIVGGFFSSEWASSSGLLEARAVSSTQNF